MIYRVPQDPPGRRTYVWRQLRRLGAVYLLSTVSLDRAWEGDLLERFNQARSAEYAEVIENVERFEDEIRRERSEGRFSFAQLEDVEGDWEKLQRWRERIRSRDFFGAPGRSDADDALTRGQAALEAFTAEVSAREGVEADSDAR